MAPMKRPAAASAEGAGRKKAKSERNAQKEVVRKVAAVAGAVRKAPGYPKEILQMLAGNLTDCLGVAKEERHPFQVQVIDMVSQVLQAAVASLEGQIAACEAKVGEADGEKVARDAAAAAKAEAHKACVEATVAAKAAHASATEGHRNAKEALEAAKIEQKAGNAELDDAGATQTSLMSAKADAFEPLKNGLLTGSAVKEAVASFVKVGKEQKFDASLMNSLPSAMSKAPDARGSFDTLVISQVEEAMLKELEGLAELLATGAPRKEERAAKVAAATATLEATVANEKAAKEAMKAAQVAEKEASDAMKAADRAVKSFAPEMKQLKTELGQHKADLEELKSGPATAFAELLELSNAPPPAPEAPVEEASGAPEAEAAAAA